MTFTIKQFDDVPVFAGTITDADGNAVDLSGSHAWLNLRALRSSEAILNLQEVTIDQGDLLVFPETKGTWHYDLDFDTLPGDTGYLYELIVADTEGNEQTYPAVGYESLIVYARLVEPV